MNLSQGAARIRIDAAEVARLRGKGVLVEDPRRTRPRYFDGRFLAARDLIRDQQYFLTREADLGQAAGSGVANGLNVSHGADADTVVVSAGDGVTPAGELVLLARELRLRLSDIAQAEQLSARFGLGRIPQPPLRSRNGLFVLCLRPVEFTANPVGAYPTSITGKRTVEDGDVIEATAVVLVPWPEDGADANLDVRRSAAARAIFVEQQNPHLSANLLPLAMLGLQNNSLAFIDAPLVRRELGADRADLPGLGFAPRALRLAHLLQHQQHLNDVLLTHGSKPFAAASLFSVLPPAGPLPPNVIAGSDFTQTYFPSQMDVDFVALPDDELAALVEESLALPPIDLKAPTDQLDAVAVMIVAPVPRASWPRVLARLSTPQRPLKPAAPNLVAQRRPLELLQRLRLPISAAPVLDQANPADAQWARLAAGTLWYVRRRNLAYRDDLVGAPLRIVNLPQGVVLGNLVTDSPRELQAPSAAKPVAQPAKPPMMKAAAQAARSGRKARPAAGAGTGSGTVTSTAGSASSPAGRKGAKKRPS